MAGTIEQAGRQGNPAQAGQDGLLDGAST